jgi:hypothetical protein
MWKQGDTFGFVRVHVEPSFFELNFVDVSGATIYKQTLSARK